MVATKKTRKASPKKSVKKAVPKKAVKKTAAVKAVSREKAVTKARVRKTAAAVSGSSASASLGKKTAGVKASLNSGVTNEKIQGMIQANLEHAVKARRPVFVDSEAMPVEYGSTSITILARDPHWVHAYWEITPSSVEALRKRLGDEVDRYAYVLRAYDVSLIEFNGSNANHWFDIVVGGEANNWYINLWSDHITCCADIGLRAPDGAFHTLARSNYVTTPREYLSPRHEMIWMDVPSEVNADDDESMPYVYVGREFAPDALNQQQDQSAGGIQPRRFRMYLTEEEIRAYYSRLFPLLSRILSLRAKRKNGRAGTSASLAGDEAVDTEEGRLLLECLEDGLEIFGYDYFRRILLGASEEMLMRERRLLDVLGGASEQSVESLRAGASEQAPGAPQDFFFELGTELIVYGRTEPDAVVFWGDRMIPLRPDGTFTLRMALPTDTHIPLDFKAVSYHKNEQRTIVTAAGREKTEYEN